MHTKYWSINFSESGHFEVAVDGILELQLNN